MSEASAILGSSSTLQVQFMKLLITQLQNQNPLEPMDNSQMTAQLAQLASLQQMEQMNGHLSGLKDETTAFGAALAAAEGRYANSLIGRDITFVDADGHPGTGRVTAAVRVDGVFVLEVGGRRVPLEAVREIRE